MAKKQEKTMNQEKNLHQKVGDKLKNAKKEYVKREKKVNEYTKKNPKKALAIAAGIGAAVGVIAAKIFGRKKKNK